MYKKITADKDTYVTNKFVDAVSAISSNVGLAGTLDLFKLYGVTTVNEVQQKELSRAFVHFDLTELKNDFQHGIIDVNHESFFCKMSLRDVYGGQPTPSNFTIEIFPLSASFDEGLGKDVARYSDKHVANWLTASVGSPWVVTGSSKGASATQTCDFITSCNSLASTQKTQYFKEGTEDLLVDVTDIISSTLSGEIPDRGFRISLSSSLEDDQKTYFVKRFASRHAYDESKRPSLVYGFDDSIRDDTLNLEFDTTCSINLYNFSQGELKNLTSGSSLIFGDNCLLLKLSTNQPSGTAGNYDLFFTGSQYKKGINYTTGVYTANVVVDKNQTINTKFMESSSIKWTTQWLSLDTKLTYSRGEDLVFFKPERGSSSQPVKDPIVNVISAKDSYSISDNDQILFRVNVFDPRNPFLKTTKISIESKNTIVKKCHYSIRDSVTNETVIPKDTINNSTKLSSDSEGMFFKLFTSALTANRTYVVDIHMTINGIEKTYREASQIFKIIK